MNEISIKETNTTTHHYMTLQDRSPSRIRTRSNLLHQRKKSFGHVLMGHHYEQPSITPLVESRIKRYRSQLSKSMCLDRRLNPNQKIQIGSTILNLF